MMNSLRRMKPLLYLLIYGHLLSHVSVGQSPKGRKNVHMIEDIQKTVSLIWSAMEKNNDKSDIDWSHKLNGFENSIYVITTRMEKIIDWIDTNKLNSKMLDDRLDKLEAKINAIDEIMTDKVDVLIAKVELVLADIKTGESSTDAKLRKLMNILSDTYQLNKDVTKILRERQGSAMSESDGSDGYDRVDELQKKLMEQLSVVEVALTNQLSGITKMSKETHSSIHDIIVEMLNLRDECHTQRVQQKESKNNEQDCDERYSNTKNGYASNTSNIQQDIVNVMYSKISEKIENEIFKISSKIDNQINNCSHKLGQNVSLASNNSSIIISPPQRTKRPINPADRPTGRSSCQHSSELLAPKSCAELRKSGSDCDGVYIITMANLRMIRVYCDMTDNGGGWTVILRRGEFGKNKHKISFNHDWNGYKEGFGDLEKGEFWLGLEKIHHLTAEGDNILQVDLESFDNDYISLVYDSFRIGDERDNYRLHLGRPYQSNETVAESFLAHNSSMFTTHDKNNAKMTTVSADNCASKLSGGWWFHNCQSAFLTAPYFRQNERQHIWQGMQWHSWKQWHHLKAAQMKIRSK